MSFKSRYLLFLLLMLVLALPAANAASPAIGSVAGSLNATLSGQDISPNATLSNGDILQVKDGAAVVAVGKGSRMVFGRNTVALFLREANEVTVLLTQGNVSIFHPQRDIALRVRVGDVSVHPASGFETSGEVALLNESLRVTTEEGLLRVENEGAVVRVAKGKTIHVKTQIERGGGGGGGQGGSGVSALQIGSLAAGGTAAVLGVVAASRASNAQDAANRASQQAASAVSAANQAASAAATAQQNALSAGCALNTLATAAGLPPPFTPPAGTTCP